MIAFLVGLSGILATGNLVWILGEAAAALGLAVLSGAGRSLARTFRALLVFLALVIAASLWEGGPLLAAAAAARVVALVAWGAALLATASPQALAEALQQWGLPLRVAFVVGAGLRFVPFVAATYRELRGAQEARGIRFAPFWRNLRSYSALLVPLLREIFRVAEHLAQAMESRGFSASHRTRVFVYRWRFRDPVAVFLSVVAFAAVLLFGR